MQYNKQLSNLVNEFYTDERRLNQLILERNRTTIRKQRILYEIFLTARTQPTLRRQVTTNNNNAIH
jgi:hypothetical protein